MSISGLARDARALAHRRLPTTGDLDAMADIETHIAAIIDERNLAVHGVRFVKRDDTVTARVTRGKYMYQPQPMPEDRLQALNDEVATSSQSSSLYSIVMA